MPASRRKGVVFASFVSAFAVAAAGLALAQESSEKPVLNRAATGKYVVFPNVPPCATGQVEQGDPATGPSIILVRFASGCSIPWHWHTPTERIMVVSGTLQLHMKGDAAATALRAGDYATAPSRHVHQARSTGPASFFLAPEGPFDIHYVDASGSEIPAEQAVKTTGKTTRAKPAAPAKKP